MKIKFLTIKKKTCFIILICALFLSVFCGSYYALKTMASSPKSLHTIVIDAGHGGRDGGAVGVSGVSEAELNLQYAKCLNTVAKEFGFKTVLTRSTSEGLYDKNASNKKKSEMEKRKQIINSSGGDVMVSIHMNSTKLSSCKGAQIFYAKDNEKGKELAQRVNASVSKTFSTARKTPSVGDYFVLNCSLMPSILVECGFISNESEEKDLKNKDYREKFCYSLLQGIISYFQM